MTPGQRIGGRFEIELPAGTGGMGRVYRALDRESGATVAVKVMQDCGAEERERFLREIRVLSELEHPGVVRYVDHGVTGEEAPGEAVPYLVMEWLGGENLGDRLKRGGLTVAESVELGSRVASALSAVHALGVVHRDVKPTNLFLVDGLVAGVRLIDFGVARVGEATRAVTRTGIAVGTPAYMAPEQARGAHHVDARADLFSLGCVLFRCLTGQAAFAAKHVMAVLAKVLLEEAPRVREIAPDIPEALDDLVARLLTKDPAGRPPSADAVAAELRALGPLEGGPPITQPPAASSGLGSGEQRLVSVLLVGAPRAGEPSSSRAAEARLAEVVAEHGASVDRLADGTRVIALVGAGAATDQAARSARCALSVRALLPARPMALSTGRGRVRGRAAVGPVIDDAARMLGAVEALWKLAGAPIGDHLPPVPIDSLTAGLLDARFDITAETGRLVLRRERESAEEVRTLLGRPTACVGRDRELTILRDLFEECVSESVARAVLVTADAGIGKSRLRHEMVRRAETRAPGLQVWIARGDPMRAGSPFGLLGQFVRRAAGLVDGDPLDRRQRKLKGRVARYVAPERVERVAEFLGETVGVPFPEHQSVELRAARQSAVLMGDQMRRAWIDFLDAECRAQPVLLVLEDLHWGDASTVEYVDSALRVLRDRPLLLLALARPEVRERFPGLWAERRVTEIRLGELSVKAGERLVRQALGDRTPPATITKLVERSAGNAFFLEELIRAAAEGETDVVPGPVLAMLHSRLEALEPEARWVLRAGSVFGQVFWRGGVAALMGGARPLEPDPWLAKLEQREWIASRSDAKFKGEREYAFRHALVREAAYGMLTDEDRALGHRLAGEWLERMGEAGAVVLAEHFDRGGEPGRAAGWYLRAAALALEGNDLAAAVGHAEHAAGGGASPRELGELGLIRAEAHRWRGEFAETERWAFEALGALPPGSDHWYDAAREVAGVAVRIGRPERVLEVATALTRQWSPERATGPGVVALVRTATQLYGSGAYDRAAALHRRIEEISSRFMDEPPVAAAIFWLRASEALFSGDAGGFHELNEEVVRRFDEAGDARSACSHRITAGYAYLKLGAFAEAAAVLRAALGDAERMGLSALGPTARHNLGLALSGLGEHDEALSQERRAALDFEAQGDRRLAGASHLYLGMILHQKGELAAAEHEARAAAAMLEIVPPLHPQALAALGDVLLARGRRDEALMYASQAREEGEALGKLEDGEALVSLVWAEALFAAGRRDEARAAIHAAQARLLAWAGKIRDEGWRESFLARVPEHARTRARARDWEA